MTEGDYDRGKPWHADDWFTSPGTSKSPSLGRSSSRSQSSFTTSTPRDGEQQTGGLFTVADRIRIASARRGRVHRIAAGMPAVSGEDERAIREIVKLGLPSRVFAFSRCMVDDIELAAVCGVRAGHGDPFEPAPH